MAEFQPVDIKKYLHNSGKALDKIDRTKGRVDSVNSVKSFSREPVEKKYQAELPADLMQSLTTWRERFQQLRVEHPNGISIVFSKAPLDGVPGTVERYPWGVIYEPGRRLLMSWGDVPARALIDKRDLETGELLTPEAVAA